MASLNKVLLIGRLGIDPELRYTQSGEPVANFRMATDESYRGADGNMVERTEWHRIVVWGKLAEPVSNYLHKGSMCYVEGSLQTRSWEDQGGVTKYTTEIKAQRVQFLDPKSASDTQGQTQAQPQGQPQGQAPRQSQGQPRGGSQSRPQQGGGAPRQQSRPQRQQNQQGYNDDDLGPAFPSDASGLDSVPF